MCWSLFLKGELIIKILASIGGISGYFFIFFLPSFIHIKSLYDVRNQLEKTLNLRESQMKLNLGSSNGETEKQSEDELKRHNDTFTRACTEKYNNKTKYQKSTQLRINIAINILGFMACILPTISLFEILPKEII